MPNRGIIDRKLRFEFARDLEQTDFSLLQATASLPNGAPQILLQRIDPISQGSEILIIKRELPNVFMEFDGIRPSASARDTFARAPHDEYRHGTVTLLAALDYLSGIVVDWI